MTKNAGSCVESSHMWSSHLVNYWEDLHANATFSLVRCNGSMHSNIDRRDLYVKRPNFVNAVLCWHPGLRWWDHAKLGVNQKYTHVQDTHFQHIFGHIFSCEPSNLRLAEHPFKVNQVFFFFLQNSLPCALLGTKSWWLDRACTAEMSNMFIVWKWKPAPVQQVRPQGIPKSSSKALLHYRLQVLVLN